MRHASWIRLLIAFVIAVTSTATLIPTASAQDDTARAIELITKANEAYDAGNFREALSDYREAYDISEDPRVLYRIGLTYENLANYQRAREHLELFLLAEPDSKYAGRVKSKIENLRKLEANLQAAIRVTSVPEGADVWVNAEQGKPAGVTPVRIPVGPGTHTLILKKEGYETLRSDVTVDTGETVEQAFDLEGGGATAETDTGEGGDETSESTEATAEEDYEFTGQPSRTYLGPSTGVTVLCWLSIAVGWIALAGASSFTAAATGPSAFRGGFFGAALMAVGGYFLWFHDWSENLPPAQAGSEAPAEASFLGMGFRF
jgi:hypothetical protein